MPWRLHLTDSAIYRLDLLGPQLVAWLAGNRAAFYELATGAFLHRETYTPLPEMDREADAWFDFLETLTLPNGDYLPRVRLPRLTIHNTARGHVRLYDDGHGLHLAVDGIESPLGVDDATLTTVALDHRVGVTAALDERCRLYIFQRYEHVGTFALNLNPRPGILPELVISEGGASIFVSDGREIVLAGAGGRVSRRVQAHYPVGRMSCSPDGTRFVTSDSDSGVLRVYEGPDLTLTHQRFAVDLLAEADPVQLLADLPTPKLSPSALAINNEGVLAFALDGVVCVTEVDALNMLPRGQSSL